MKLLTATEIENIRAWPQMVAYNKGIEALFDALDSGNDEQSDEAENFLYDLNQELLESLEVEFGERIYDLLESEWGDAGDWAISVATDTGTEFLTTVADR